MGNPIYHSDSEEERDQTVPSNSPSPGPVVSPATLRLAAAMWMDYLWSRTEADTTGLSRHEVEQKRQEAYIIYRNRMRIIQCDLWDVYGNFIDWALVLREETDQLFGIV